MCARKKKKKKKKKGGKNAPKFIQRGVIQHGLVLYKLNALKRISIKRKKRYSWSPGTRFAFIPRYLPTALPRALSSPYMGLPSWKYEKQGPLPR
jgi:hypothetical protein